MLHPPLEERVWLYDVDVAARHGAATAPAAATTRVDLPLDPMHGTVGVAPAAFEAPDDASRPTRTAATWTPRSCAPASPRTSASTCRARCSPSATGTAARATARSAASAVEAAMNTVVVVELIKGAATPWPRLESDDHLMSTGSARPLEDAYRISQHDLVTWTADAGRAGPARRVPAGQPGRRGAGRQRLRPQLHDGREGGKRYLPSVDMYQGAHARLRALAASYR